MSTFRHAFSLTVRSIASYTALLAAAVSLGWLARSLDSGTDLHFSPWAFPGKADLGVPLVVIDAGHGGHDGGAVANGLVEKTITLDLAERVREKLLTEGVAVEMTRTKDVFISLEDRSAFAAEHCAAAFVSLHLNTSVEAPDVMGVETFYTLQKSLQAQQHLKQTLLNAGPGPFKDERGAWLARVVQKAVCHQTDAENRGIKERRYAVVAHTACPAILVECGFLTSVSEAAKLKQAAYRDRIATGVAQGILTFVKIQQANPERGIAAVQDGRAEPEAIAAAP